jgi:hypothetical protein
VDSTTLIDYLARSHSLASAAALHAFLGTTGRTHLGVDLAYYERRLYWVITYEGSKYTVLDANFSNPDDSTLDCLKPMIESTLDVGAFVDLREEEAMRKARLLARKVVISAVMLGDGAVPEKSIADGLGPYKLEGQISPEYVHEAAAGLVKEGFLVVDNSQSLAFASAVKTNIELRGQLFTLLLRETFVVLPLGCKWWDQHVDRKLLEHIFKLQGDLILEERDIAKAETLVRFSPSALIYALTPDPMIVGHRDGPHAVEITDDMRQQDARHFMRSLYEKFIGDFNSVQLSKYFYAERRVGAVKQESRITVYDVDDAVLITDEVQDTHMIGPWHEKDAKGETVYLHIAALPDFAERRKAAKLEQERAEAICSSPSDVSEPKP